MHPLGDADSISKQRSFQVPGIKIRDVPTSQSSSTTLNQSTTAAIFSNPKHSSNTGHSHMMHHDTKGERAPIVWTNQTKQPNLCLRVTQRGFRHGQTLTRTPASFLTSQPKCQSRPAWQGRPWPSGRALTTASRHSSGSLMPPNLTWRRSRGTRRWQCHPTRRLPASPTVDQNRPTTG